MTFSTQSSTNNTSLTQSISYLSRPTKSLNTTSPNNLHPQQNVYLSTAPPLSTTRLQNSATLEQVTVAVAVATVVAGVAVAVGNEVALQASQDLGQERDLALVAGRIEDAEVISMLSMVFMEEVET